MQIDVEITSVEIRKCTDVPTLHKLLENCGKDSKRTFDRLLKARQQKREVLRVLRAVVDSRTQENFAAAEKILKEHQA